MDADACPREARHILRRASRRLQIPLVFVSNHDLGEPRTELVSPRIVPPRADEADQTIAREVEPGDLVITADVPLAAEVVGRGADAMDTRGEQFDEDDVHVRLSQRNLMEELRGAGLVQGGPSEYGDVDKQRFAAALDRWLTRQMRERKRRESGPGSSD